ncbi:MAG: cation:proton antiporter [Rhodospirillales bacterium]|nr:cation:proton antiporter [Alphaproteobacteria bacterium]USO03062.1 MAG: cation:proton antiporter [Rhodospirillales bacterium]
MEDHGTLTQLALLLAAAFAGGALLQRLNQPVLVGYILVGFILGPSALGIVHDEEQIKTLAELGILLLLFIVGLELDLKKFAPVYRAAIIVTLSQIVIALAAMFALGSFLEWPLARILLLGFALSLSSTAVAIKLLQDMGELNTTLGRAAIGILIAQDIAVIPMLLIMGGMSGNGFNLLEIPKILLAIGFMASLIVTLNRKPHWFARLMDMVPQESQTAVTALAICFSAAALSGLVGLSAAYGAFLAGLVIGNTAKRSAYEEHIKPIFEVLMMMFFLSIGLLIDLDFLSEKFWRVMALLGIAMMLKTIVNITILRGLGFSRRNSLVMGATLGQIGEFSFVLAALGLSTGAIMPEGHKYVVSIIALSLVITPLWLYGIRRMNLLSRHNKRHRETRTHGE